MSPSKQNKDPEITAAAPRAWKIKLIVSGLLLLFVAAALMNLPRGYSDDLSRIGKGKAAIVLIRDKNAVQALDLMEVTNSIRNQYAGQIEFLLTDFDTLEGRAFITANNAERVTLVLFDAQGSRVKILHPPQSAESLRQEISLTFGIRS